MSEDTAAFTVTLKQHGGYDSSWIVVRGDSAAEAAANLNALDPVIAAALDADARFKAYSAAAPLAPQGSVQQAIAPAPQAVPPAPWENQQQGNTPPTPAPAWNTGQPQQQAAPAQSGGYQPHPSAVLHPEGKRCDFQGCGLPLEQKKTQNGKLKWQCGQWRWNNGTPNGHAMEWAN